MKFLSGFIFLFLLSLIDNKGICQNHSDQSQQISMALILKVNGNENVINDVSTYRYSFYNGRIKDNYTVNSDSKSGYLHLVINDENGKNVFDGFVENPLARNTEVFHPDGSIENTGWKKKEDYINLRFYISKTIKQLNIRSSYFKDSNEEVFVSEFKLNLK